MDKYKTYTLRNFRQHPVINSYLTDDEKFDIEVVGEVLPFKVNNYVIEQLIDWSDYHRDPVYNLTFPNRDMLKPNHYHEMAGAITLGAEKPELKLIANKIRCELNPHPAGQKEHNSAALGELILTGVQHKYRETLLFFPSQGQTCHAFCTFCFRWPQFVGMHDLKFAMRDTELLIRYLRAHPEVTDVLFTGGDPLIMKTKLLSGYLDALIEARLPSLRTIRLGTKSLSYWPYRFVTDEDADDLLNLLGRVHKAGIHIAFMAHFNHPNEMKTEIVRKAIENILGTGAVIRTQAPVMRHINDEPDIWAQMWQKQVELGCIPYYMFQARDTGAQDYFAVALETALNIFRKAYQSVSGIARTVRGPIMSSGPGKVQILGISEIGGEKVFALQFLQGRDPDWVCRPFFARYDPSAKWLDELYPASGREQFFFEKKYAIERSPSLDRIALN